MFVLSFTLTSVLESCPFLRRRRWRKFQPHFTDNQRISVMLRKKKKERDIFDGSQFYLAISIIYNHC